MYEVTAGAGEERVPQRRFTLPSILLVAAALAFVTALILLSGEPSPAWFFYLLPIVVGALVYDVAGGVVMTALCAGALLLASPASAVSESATELIAGFTVFLMCGVVVGVQAQRQRMHNVALERASMTDSSTGTLKAEHLIGALSDEIRRGDRYGNDVGLVLLRVEDFDEFARVFGHYKAESMLRHLADVIRLTVRTADTLGRLDPTTFAVVLPCAGSAQASAVADRLSKTTRAAEFEGDALEPITACVTTAASASYPQDAIDQSDLLLRTRLLLEEATVRTGAPSRTIESGALS